MGDSTDISRPITVLRAASLACAVGSFASAGVGSWSLVMLIAYRHFSPEALLTLVSPALAVAALVSSVVGLKRGARRIGWLVLAVATLSLAFSATRLSSVIYVGAPLRTGSGGLVGADEGTRLPLDSMFHTTVPDGWVAEVGTADGGFASLAMAPIDEAMPGMTDMGGDRSVTFTPLPPSADPDRTLELLGQRSKVVSMTIEATTVSGVVRRDMPFRGLENQGTVDALDLVIKGDSAVLVSANFHRTDLPVDAQDDDQVFLEWFGEFIRLSR